MGKDFITGYEGDSGTTLSSAPWAPGSEPPESFASYFGSSDMSSIEEYVNGVPSFSISGYFDEVGRLLWDSLPFTNGFELRDLWALLPIALLWGAALLWDGDSDSEESTRVPNKASSPSRATSATYRTCGPGYSKTEHPFHYRTGWKDAERSPLTGEFNEPTTGVEEYSPSEWEAYCIGFEERMEKDYKDCDVRETRVKELSRAFQAKALAVEARNELRHGPYGPFEAI